MDMEMILKELDRLFATYQMDKVEGFLENKMAQAASVEDDNSLITLLNEMIGYLRDVSKYEKCCMYCDRLLNVLEKNGLKGTIPYATSLLNIANAYRAAGLLAESMTNYKTVCLIYQSQLEDNDFRFASLYNNMSLLYQEMGEFEEACVCLEKALSIVKNYEEARIETAVSLLRFPVTFHDCLLLFFYDGSHNRPRRCHRPASCPHLQTKAHHYPSGEET